MPLLSLQNSWPRWPANVLTVIYNFSQRQKSTNPFADSVAPNDVAMYRQQN